MAIEATERARPGAALRTSKADWSETDLVAAARAGDGTAFEVIMRRNNQRLFRTARSILKNDADAEDVVQETYVKAYAKFGDFAGEARLSTWLVRIAVNESLGRLRRRMPAGNLEDVTDEMMTEPSSPSQQKVPRALSETPESRAAQVEIRGLLEGAIDDLPQSLRAVFVLRAVEEFSVEDTAASLGIPKNTVKTRFHRAKCTLRHALQAKLQSALLGTFPFAGARCDRVVATVLQRVGLTSAGLGAQGVAREDAPPGPDG